MYRTSIQKYKNYSAAGQVIKELCPTLADLLNKIENYVSEHEVIEVHQWVGGWFYITVEDERMKQPGVFYPHAVRVGFTVNIERDRIMWANDAEDNFSGGNCFVRSHKWKVFCTKNFGKENIQEKIHWYKTKNIDD